VAVLGESGCVRAEKIMSSLKLCSILFMTLNYRSNCFLVTLLIKRRARSELVYNNTELVPYCYYDCYHRDAYGTIASYVSCVVAMTFSLSWLRAE